MDYSYLLSRGDCEKILSRYEKKPCKLRSFDISKLSENVVGFLGDHFILTVKYEVLGVNKLKTFFLKTPPVNNVNQKKYVLEVGIFKKELLVYNNLIPELLRLASKPFCANCYFVKNDECIVLEDLGVKGFSLADDCLYLDVERCKSTLVAMAAMHGASISFEEQRSTNGLPYRINQQFVEETKCCTYNFVDGELRDLWCKTNKKTIKEMAKMFKTSDDISEKLENFVTKKMPGLVGPSIKYRNVLTHDDLWTNNLLFNTRNQCMIVDFQLTKYAPPIFDLLVFLYTSTEQKEFTDNLQFYLDFYYDKFTEELRRHKLDTTKILPKTEFLETVEEYKIAAMIEALMYGCTIYVTEELKQKIISSMEIFQDFTFHNRDKYVMKEYLENEEVRSRFNNTLIPLFEMLNTQ